MNFNDFCKNENFKKKQNNINTSKEQKDNSKIEEDVNNLYEKYKNLNQNELMEELLKQTTMKKQNGSLTNEGLENIKNSLAPFLNEVQNKNLNGIIERLK